jgi:hypothetical protein
MSEKEQFLSLAEYLHLDDYGMKTDDKDPGKEDVYFLVKVAKLIPKTPDKLSDVDAGLIATYCLAAIQTANVKYSKALMWQRLKKIKMDAVLGDLMRNSEKVTIAEKVAKSDPAYIEAANIYALAESYVEYYKNLLENFRATHYWARAQEVEERSESRMSGYDPHDLDGKGARRGSRNTSEEGGDVDLSR